jgi:hypothetical protein
MKLPAVAIAAAFVCGIAAGLHPPVVHHVIAPAFLGRCWVPHRGWHRVGAA